MPTLIDRSTRPLQVLLIDDHQLLAHAVAIALRLESVQATLADLNSPDSIIASVRADPPDLVLLDLCLGEGPSDGLVDGAALVRPLTDAGTRVLVLTGTTDRCWLASAVEAGAIGVLSKADSLDDVVVAILKAASGDEVMSGADRSAMLAELHEAREQRERAQEPFRRLTSRERQVLRALGRGKTVSGIAQEWVVSEATVRSQVRGVLTKLGVRSQLEAVACALRSGWLTSVD